MFKHKLYTSSIFHSPCHGESAGDVCWLCWRPGRAGLLWGGLWVLHIVIQRWKLRCVTCRSLKLKTFNVTVVATQRFLIFTSICGRFPFWRSDFSDGLKPTSWVLKDVEGCLVVAVVNGSYNLMLSHTPHMDPESYGSISSHRFR